MSSATLVSITVDHFFAKPPTAPWLHLREVLTDPKLRRTVWEQFKRAIAKAVRRSVFDPSVRGDIAVQVAVKCWKTEWLANYFGSVSAGKSKGSMYGWFCTIARGIAVKLAEKNQRRAELLEENTVESKHDVMVPPEPLLDGQYAPSAAQFAMAQLGADERIPFSRLRARLDEVALDNDDKRILEGLANQKDRDEIGAEMGISQAKMSRRISQMWERAAQILAVILLCLFVGGTVAGHGPLASLVHRDAPATHSGDPPDRASGDEGAERLRTNLLGNSSDPSGMLGMLERADHRFYLEEQGKEASEMDKGRAFELAVRVTRDPAAADSVADRTWVMLARSYVAVSAEDTKRAATVDHVLHSLRDDSTRDAQDVDTLGQRLRDARVALDEARNRRVEADDAVGMTLSEVANAEARAVTAGRAERAAKTEAELEQARAEVAAAYNELLAVIEERKRHLSAAIEARRAERDATEDASSAEDAIMQMMTENTSPLSGTVDDHEVPSDGAGPATLPRTSGRNQNKTNR
ncbi:MAG: hypothetical protein QM778_18505 [Myxococcales bacterium]